MTNPVEAVLFDLDGTLATSVRSLQTSYERFLRSFDVTGTKQEFEELIGPSLFEVTQILQQRHALPGDLNQLYQKYLEIVNEDYTKDVTPQEGAGPLLAWLCLNKIRCALVTSAPSLIARSFLERFDLDQFFAVIVTGDDVTASKPSPEPYLHALRQLKVDADFALAVEDSPKGIQSACNAGLRVLGLTTNEHEQLRANGAHRTIERLEELKPLVEERS